MSSRKTFLKKISPFKGTGRYLQYVRCPCCGKLARGQALGNAGEHQLSVSQCTGPKGGYRAGFNWEHVKPTREILEALRESLERALEQVGEALGVVNLPGFGEPVMPALVGVLGGPTIPLEVFVYGDQREVPAQGEAVHPIVQTYDVRRSKNGENHRQRVKGVSEGIYREG